MPLLIKNTLVIDGTGKEPFRADVIVKHGRIAAIGTFSRYHARETIDGLGAYLAPGAIDMGTTADRYLTLFKPQTQLHALSRGITTLIGGQCGISLAPFSHATSYLLREWSASKKVNVNWQTIRELFRTLARHPFLLNFGTFVGHTTLVSLITGAEGAPLAAPEMGAAALLTERAMKEGAFGISSGRGYSRLHPVPHREIEVLLARVRERRGAYAAHLPHTPKEVVGMIDECIALAKQYGIPIIVNHLRPEPNYNAEYEQSLARISEHAAEADVYFTVHPEDLRVMRAYLLLPAWSRAPREEGAFGEKNAVRAHLADAQMRRRIIKELPRFKGDAIGIIRAPRLAHLEGKSLGAFSRERHLTLHEALLRLIEGTDGDAVIFYRDLSSPLTHRALAHDRAIAIARVSGFEAEGETHDALRPPQIFFSRIQENAGLSIGAAVYKCTGLPAKVLGIKNRGCVKRGYWADLVLFRDYEAREVFVNGVRVIQNGVACGVRAGRTISPRL